MNKNLNNTALYNNIRQAIEQARRKVATTINVAMVEAYWHIGRMIVEEEQAGNERATYGDKLIPRLAAQLSADFGKGFNNRNLFYMKQFYLSFPKVNALRGELSWTNYRLLLKVENEKGREFYIKEAIDSHWSTRTLERQINSFYYERLLASQDKKPVVEEAGKKVITIQPSVLFSALKRMKPLCAIPSLRTVDNCLPQNICYTCLRQTSFQKNWNAKLKPLNWRKN